MFSKSRLSLYGLAGIAMLFLTGADTSAQTQKPGWGPIPAAPNAPPAAVQPRSSTPAAPAAATAPEPSWPPPPPSSDWYLVRQDFSDCTNSNVNANNPSLIGGSIWVWRLPDGTTNVQVAITAQPNTTYHFFLKCVRQLGDVVTGDEGIGKANFTFPTNTVGNVFAFDVYPEGAPAGNKFQSVQVTMK